MATPAKKLHWTRGEKALFAASGGVILLAVFGTVWWQIANTEPVVDIPTLTLPNPNAFDVFVRAGDGIVDAQGLGKLAEPDEPDKLRVPPAQRERQVKANAEALATLRTGFAHPYHEPPARSFNHLFPHYAKFRNLAQLLVLEGQAKAARGDHGGAMNSYLDAVQMGQDIPRGGVLIGRLVGIAAQAIGRGPAWQTVKRLDARQSRAAARRTEQIAARHVPFADTLQEEKWFGQASLLEMFRDPEFFAQAAGDGQIDDGGRFLVTASILLHGKRKILNRYTRYLDENIANARLPYAARPPEPQIPNDPINQILAPVFSQSGIKDVNGSETQNALLTVALALRAYQAEQGRYPERLAELAPEYLKSVPVDPFALEGPLRYRRTATGYVLYSVGPDGKGDGGRPIDNAFRPDEGEDDSLKKRRMVRGDSRGDIVAGVNF